MAYGFATHLWILGAPEADKVRQWLLAAVPSLHESDVEAWRLGDRLLLGAVNTSDRDLRWRSIGAVQSFAAQVRGFEWVSIDLQPDHGSWSVERSSGESFTWDPNSDEPPEGPADDDARPPAELVEKAKAVVKSIVPLELKELHHYVDWAHALEETEENQLAPALAVPVHRVPLGLPAAPPPPPTLAAARAAGAGLSRHWLSIACIVATCFTVSAVQPAGPGGFLPRLTHFLIQSSALWMLSVGLMGVTSNGWPGVRNAIASCGMMVAAALVWGLVPI